MVGGKEECIIESLCRLGDGKELNKQCVMLSSPLWPTGCHDISFCHGLQVVGEQHIPTIVIATLVMVSQSRVGIQWINTCCFTTGQGRLSFL